MVINENKDKRQFAIRYFVCRADSNGDTSGLEGLTDFQWIFFISVYDDKRFGEGYTCLVTCLEIWVRAVMSNLTIILDF